MDRDVTLREVVDRGFVGVSEADDLLGTVELMLAEEADAAVVLRGSDPVGLVTERDVLELVAAAGGVDGATVEDAMSPSLPTVDSGATIGEAADRLSTESTRRLVVVDDGEVLGVLTDRDLLATRPAPTNGHDATAATPPAEAAGAAVAEEASGAGAGAETGAAGGFQDQSICEGCGTLSSDLVSFNGQLLCADCRDM